MDDPVRRIPVPRPEHPAETEGRASAPRSVPLTELTTWHRPGVHQVRLANRDVWVRMDERGIVSISTAGPERLAGPALD